MGIKKMISKTGEKAANKVAKLAALSPEQLEEVQNNRDKYLSEMPDPNDAVAEELTKRLLAASSVEIFNAYLPQLQDLYVPVKKEVEYGGIPFNPEYNIRYFNITKWVTDKKENNLEKLVNVYEVLSNEACNIALIFNRKCNVTEVFLAVVNTQNADNNVDVENYKERLANAIKGNFPGSELSEVKCGTLPCFINDNAYSVASASNIPTEKSEKFISQTIEKLIDGCVPDTNAKEYTIILLATPILDVQERKLRLAEFYSGLAPYSNWSTNFTYTESNATNSSATVGVNVGASAGIQNGQNQSVTDTQGVTDNASQTATEGTNSSTATGENSSTTKTTGTNGSISESVMPMGVGVSATQGTSKSTGTTTGTSKTLTEGVSKSLAKTLGRAVSSSVAKTAGVFSSTNFGVNFGANFARSSSVTATIGKNEGITQNYTNYTIKHALDLLEEQMKRFEQSTALGMWDFAAYVLSEDQNVANNVAHSYVALTQGSDSYMSQSAINLWRGDMGEHSDDAKEICDYLKELRHPVFGLSPALVTLDSTFLVYPTVTTATTSLSGKELAYSLNFPQKSIVGLPVIECAEFGRNISTYDNIETTADTLKLGNIYHMQSKEKGIVKLSKQSLASHTFITGSTGSGKSNTVYRILDEALDKEIKFLVIEPAKGEYKSVFGMANDVTVYSTNPEIADLLKINPFSFPKGIHILEHLDRLVELFNVCWPMYAAMPAVLKQAVEKAYTQSGWNLNTSKNKYGENIFPTFADVASNVKTIIDTSEYDNDNKGAYKGALLTRLQSLTNGINGMIFVQDEIPTTSLFEENVIVDLSRVGSSETKSLIMGMLVLKLQEHRMTTSSAINQELKHITVLEEAHNILKRTSTEQSSETANLIGKSVEMISNSIAEMRTYGEGFIIVDQAPGLLDMSTIRNTNTKIIMRLPDFSDRELVGKSANLNDDQITELAKLPCGVAAVYQNEWIQPVLCKVDKFDDFAGQYEYTMDESIYADADGEIVKDSLLDVIMNKEIFRKTDFSAVENLKSVIIKSKIDTVVKCDFIEYLTSEKENAIEKLRVLLYDLLEARNAIIASQDCNNINEWVHSVVDGLSPSIKNYTNKQIDLALALILYEQALRDKNYNDIFCRFTEIYKNEGGVF